MKRWLVLGVVGMVAGCISGWAFASTAFFSPPATISQFGYIRSINLTSKGYELKLDPAYFLEGLTAQRAAAADGRTVENDYYILNGDHRQLTYRLPASASATVLTNASGGIRSTKVPVSELAQIVKGKNPAHRPLLEQGSTRLLGYWVKTKIDTVQSIDQQYQP